MEIEIPNEALSPDPEDQVIVLHDDYEGNFEVRLQQAKKARRKEMKRMNKLFENTFIADLPLSQQKLWRAANHQQRLFLVNWNKSKTATAAALAAGYSPKSAATMGARLKKKFKPIIKMIDEILPAIALTNAIDVQISCKEALLERQFNIAIADYGKMIRMTYEELEEEGLTCCVKKWEHVERTVPGTDKEEYYVEHRPVEFLDPMKAAELLSKMAGFIETAKKVSGLNVTNNTQNNFNQAPGAGARSGTDASREMSTPQVQVVRNYVTPDELPE